MIEVAVLLAVLLPLLALLLYVLWVGLIAAVSEAVESIGHVPLRKVDEVEARQFTGTLDPYTGVASLIALPRPALERGEEVVPWKP